MKMFVSDVLPEKFMPEEVKADDAETEITVLTRKITLDTF